MTKNKNLDPVFRDILNDFLNEIATASVNSGSDPDGFRCPDCESMRHRYCDPERLEAEEILDTIEWEKE